MCALHMLVISVIKSITRDGKGMYAWGNKMSHTQFCLKTSRHEQEDIKIDLTEICCKCVIDELLTT